MRENMHQKVFELVLEAKATITGDVKGSRLRVYVPTSLSLDSTFPFKKGDTILIKIEAIQKRLVIEGVHNDDST